ncbi:MAG TPA: hydantoinase/oxoprolinase family protein [Gemmatimonadales bacterium]|nr:hydantoinase/oxoprolinase family protein [Gemmatimonadales bacterium]
MSGIIGWDIGGVNTKAARVESGRIVRAAVRPYEIQRDPAALELLLVNMAAALGGTAGDAHALTMTAELSQVFRTKREGVRAVVDAACAAFGAASIQVFSVDGVFLDPDSARSDPLSVAAANWRASAELVASTWADAVLVDIGSTTTDIIPIVAGTVRARGRTDPERLEAGELVYTGAVRTPAEALLPGLAAEGFALSGDVYVWRRQLTPADYTFPTPDGRPATRQFAGERLARVICADREMLDDRALDGIAERLAGAQLDRVVDGLSRVLARCPELRGSTAVLAGIGTFIAREAVERAGLTPVSLSIEYGDSAVHAPAAAAALLLARSVAVATR